MECGFGECCAAAKCVEVLNLMVDMHCEYRFLCIRHI